MHTDDALLSDFLSNFIQALIDFWYFLRWEMIRVKVNVVIDDNRVKLADQG